MEDRLKYRVFDKDTNQLHDVILFNFDRSPGIVEWRNNDGKKRAAFIGEVPIMQCTGLRDSKGNLIYEGDILEYKDHMFCFDNPNGIHWGFIKWQVNAAKFTCQRFKIDKKTVKLEYGLTSLYYSTAKIIGNVHQNPELLEVKE